MAIITKGTTTVTNDSNIITLSEADTFDQGAARFR